MSLIAWDRALQITVVTMAFAVSTARGEFVVGAFSLFVCAFYSRIHSVRMLLFNWYERINVPERVEQVSIGLFTPNSALSPIQ